MSITISTTNENMKKEIEIMKEKSIKKATELNMNAVEGALKHMFEKIEEQDSKITGLISTISTLQSELNNMNQRYAMIQAQIHGTGATT